MIAVHVFSLQAVGPAADGQKSDLKYCARWSYGIVRNSGKLEE